MRQQYLALQCGTCCQKDPYLKLPRTLSYSASGVLRRADSNGSRDGLGLDSGASLSCFSLLAWASITVSTNSCLQPTAYL